MARCPAPLLRSPLSVQSVAGIDRRGAPAPVRLPDPAASMAVVSRSQSRSPLVGRSEELAVLLAALERAAAGESGAVVVSGEAGVGKTRLLEELADQAGRAGATVLVGHCLDIGEVGLPYLPFTEALAPLGAPTAPAGAWSSLVLPAAGTDAGQLRVFESVLKLLVGAGRAYPGRADLTRGDDGQDDNRPAKPGPVLLLLEDLQWADRSSRDLLAFLLARSRGERVLVVASYRTDDLHRRHPLRPLLAQLARSPDVDQVGLAGLGESDMAAYLREVAGTAVDEVIVRRIHARSAGNAYYARELWESGDRTGDAALPAPLADLLLTRVADLPEDANTVVRAAAVGGARVRHDLLAVVTALADHDLESALQRTVARHVLVPAGDDGYAFRHALLAEAVYADLLPGERTRLHAAWARTLADHGPDGRRPGSAAELAHHRMASHDVPGALLASVEAAAEAERLDAPAEAWQQLERALQLWEAVSAGTGRTGQPVGDVLPGTDVVDLGLRAAAMASRAGSAVRAIALAEAAADRLDENAEPARAADAYRMVAVYLANADREGEAVAAASRARLLTARGPETAAAAWAAATEAVVLRMLDREPEARAAALEGRAIAVRTGTPAAEADALVTLAALESVHGRAASVADLLAKAGERAALGGDVTVELRLAYSLAVDRYEAGDVHGALDLLEVVVPRSASSGMALSPWGLELRVLQSTAKFVSGDWPGSRAAVRPDRLTPPEPAAAWLAATSLYVGVAVGDPDAAGVIDWLKGSGHHGDVTVAVLTGAAESEFARWNGDPARALEVAERTLRHLHDAGYDGFLGGIRLCAVGLAAAGDRAEHARLIGDSDVVAAVVGRAGVLVERARTTARVGQPLGAGLGPEGTAWLDRVEAEHARAVGIPARELWERALDGFHRYGHRYEQARCQLGLAEAMLATGNRQAAGATARSAHNTAVELGARPLRDAIQVAARRGRLDLGSSVPAVASVPGSLTKRESEVLLLLAAGRTNRQIAAALFMAEKTASVHVSRILTKLGASSRAEAVTRGHDLGLLVARAGGSSAGRGR